MENPITVVVPDAEHDYHGHPNYNKIYFWLLGLFGLSLVVSLLFSPVLAVSLIFLTAVIKTALVVNNFMHAKYEPFLVVVFVVLVVFILGALLFGMMPDITYSRLQLAP